MNFSAFLTWLVASGGCIIAASWILGRFAKYAALADNIKQDIFFGVAAVLGVGAYAALTYVPANIINAISPYFLIVSGIFTIVFINNTYTKINSLYSMTKLQNKK